MPRDTGLTFDMTGKPIVQGRGSVSGIKIIKKERDMAKAKQNGVYTLNGQRFVIRSGDILPDGAELDQVPEPVADASEAEQVGQRALKNAPENKAKSESPENRNK